MAPRETRDRLALDDLRLSSRSLAAICGGYWLALVATPLAFTPAGLQLSPLVGLLMVVATCVVLGLGTAAMTQCRDAWLRRLGIAGCVLVSMTILALICVFYLLHESGGVSIFVSISPHFHLTVWTVFFPLLLHLFICAGFGWRVSQALNAGGDVWAGAAVVQIGLFFVWSCGAWAGHPGLLLVAWIGSILWLLCITAMTILLWRNIDSAAT